MDTADRKNKDMGNLGRVMAAAAIAFFYVAHGLWLLLLFPHDPNLWLGAFVIVPVYLLLAGGIGTAAFFSLKWASSRRRAATIVASFFMGIVLAGLVLFPISPYEPGPFGQIAQYHSAFQRYPDDIAYEDAFYGNRAEQVAAKVKYPNVPDAFLTVTFDEAECWIGIRHGTIASYDNSQIEVSDDGGRTVMMTTYPTDPIRRTAHEVGKADLAEAADDASRIEREAYTIYPGLGTAGLVFSFPQSDLLPDSRRQVNLVPTTGDAIFAWMLRTFR